MPRRKVYLKGYQPIDIDDKIDDYEREIAHMEKVLGDPKTSSIWGPAKMKHEAKAIDEAKRGITILTGIKKNAHPKAKHLGSYYGYDVKKDTDVHTVGKGLKAAPGDRGWSAVGRADEGWDYDGDSPQLDNRYGPKRARTKDEKIAGIETALQMIRDPKIVYAKDAEQVDLPKYGDFNEEFLLKDIRPTNEQVSTTIEEPDEKTEKEVINAIRDVKKGDMQGYKMLRRLMGIAPREIQTLLNGPIEGGDEEEDPALGFDLDNKSAEELYPYFINQAYATKQHNAAVDFVNRRPTRTGSDWRIKDVKID